MERYSMFLGRKNQYCENDYPTKRNLQMQCDPYQVTNGIFFIELEQKISQFIWKHEKSWIAKAVLRKKNEAGGNNVLISDYTTKLQSSRQYGTGTETEI